MLRNRTLAASRVAGLVLVSGVAWAVTEAELKAEATALLTDFEALEVDIDNCPNGTCSEAQDLIDELDALGSDLVQLHADRDLLQGCGCQALDGLLDDLDDIEGELQLITDNWISGG